MIYQEELHITKARKRYFDELLELTGEEIYTKYGLDRDDKVSETVKFPGTDYEAIISVTTPEQYDFKGGWADAELRKAGRIVDSTDCEITFHDKWILEHDGNTFIVKICISDEKT